MKLIVGLGNPGEKYKNNRHNIGHTVIDEIKGRGLRIKDTIFAKTNTFMNDSGISVNKILRKNNITPENLYVIHDDLDLPLGIWKIQLAKGPKGNGGINSIEQVLGTDNFWRIRVGIDSRNPKERVPGEEYVLEDFSKSEKVVFEKVVREIVEYISKQFS